MRRYYHGPARGRRPTDTLTRPVTEMIPRAHLAGPLGWCMLCPDSDTQATVVGVWVDPETGEVHHNVRACDACAKEKGVS